MVSLKKILIFFLFLQKLPSIEGFFTASPLIWSESMENQVTKGKLKCLYKFDQKINSKRIFIIALTKAVFVVLLDDSCTLFKDGQPLESVYTYKMCTDDVDLNFNYRLEVFFIIFQSFLKTAFPVSILLTPVPNYDFSDYSLTHL